MRIGGYELGGGWYEQRRAVALALPLAFNAATTNHDAALVLLDSPSSRRPIRLAPGMRLVQGLAGRVVSPPSFGCTGVSCRLTMRSPSCASLAQRAPTPSGR